MERNGRIIRNVKVYGESRVYEQGYVHFEDGKIVSAGEDRDLEGQFAAHTEQTKFNQGYICIPGFIDVHIHGAAGADVMDATAEALKKMAYSLPKEGTTSFLATTMTQESGAIEKALQNAGSFMDEQETSGVSEMLGIHLEGPFLSPEKAGAQPVEHILEPDADLFDTWQQVSRGHIRMATIAPEREGGCELIRHLAEKGVVASIGHTNATYEQCKSGVEAGATHVTHLFNGMSGLHHREPGAAGAALLMGELTAELIADGFHSRPEMIDLAFRTKKEDALVLITDSMRAKCLKNGSYDLGGQKVIVKDGQARLEGGSLAGSVLKMSDAFRNMIRFTDCSIHQAVKMASFNPARQLKVSNRKGSIAPGKDADLVILDESLDVFMTICRGEVAYDREANGR